MESPEVILSLGDFHCGSSVGLLPPGMQLVRVGPRGEMELFEPELNLTQEMLWKLFERQLHDAVKVAGGRPIGMILGGDLGQGTKYIEQCFPGGERARNQIRMAVKCVRVAAQITNPVRIWIVLGTPSHTDVGTIEAEIARELMEGYEVSCAYHPVISVGEIEIDAAHHGAGKGGRNWLSGNILRYYLRDKMWDDIKVDQRPPEIYDRHHFHGYRREELDETWRGQTVTSQIALVPSYSGMTAHAEQWTRSEPYLENGLVVYVIARKPTIVPIVHRTDLRTRL